MVKREIVYLCVCVCVCVCVTENIGLFTWLVVVQKV